MDRGSFARHTKNEPQLFDFYVTQIAGDTEWAVPRRGAYVRFVDDRWESRHHEIQDGVLFTGYITEDPEPVFLGVNKGNVWSYKVRCTSEEFLANSKRLPAGTYVNKTRGYILADLLNRLFAGSSPFPFNTAGVKPGGTEQLFQVDTSQSWSELAAAFANADGYSYWILDSYVFYGPENIVTAYNDPLYLLAIDKYDPRFVPGNLDIKRVSRDIINDVTVLGADEPTDVVREHFVSDGYQGGHNLAFDPFGIVESVIVEDDFTADLDTTLWLEKDAVADYIQPFNGALNIIGGPGNPATSATPRTVYVMARKPIELNGVLEFRDGEVYFPPSPTGTGYIGGLYTDETLAVNTLWSGWYLNLNNNTISAYGLGGVQQGTPYSIVRTRHYMLRRIIQVDKQVGTAQAYTQSSTGKKYSISVVQNPNVSMSYIIDEINNDDIANVFTTSTVVYSTSFTANPPDYVIFAPVVPNDCKYVTNFLSVKRPQQAVLSVNKKPVKLGSYLDGGRATLQSDNGKGKLSWYSVPGNAVGYANTVLGDSPSAYWRLGESSGTSRNDSSGHGLTGTATNVTQGATGAIQGDADYANTFNGTSSVILGSTMLTKNNTSYEAWFKSTSASTNMTIWSNRDASGLGDFLAVSSGQVFYGSNDLTGRSSIRSGLNDGRWHHVVWTIATAGTNNSQLYIDGVFDSQFTGSKTAKNTPWTIGKDIYVNTVTPGAGWFVGDIDEVAIYSGTVLTAAQVKAHYNRGISTSGDVVTVPKAGSLIELSYYRKKPAAARLISQDSINTERERYRDDGIRQKVIRAEDVKPTPRTSEECLTLAQAILYDSSKPRHEGKYSFEAVQDTPTELRFWPRPGDRINCTLDLPTGDTLNEMLSIQTVESELTGKGAYNISLGFGPVNRFDIVIRNLILKRKSSFDDPIIKQADTETLELLNQAIPFPGDLLDCRVTAITATDFSIQLAQAGIPADVVNYEVREDDTGWGKPNYVVRFRAATRTFTRPKRDIRYFIRPYNAANQYSQRSAFLRIVCPTANSYAVTGVTGDINSQRCRIVVPIPRDPDYAGVRIQQYNAGGAIYYQGNGDQHDTLGSGVTVLLSAGLVSVDIPNTGFYDAGAGIPSFTAYVNTYNLLNLFGTGQTVTISTASSGSWTSQVYSGGLFTGNGAMTWTVDSADVVTLGYQQSVNTMTVNVVLDTTTVAGTPNTTLQIAIPNGKTAAKKVESTCLIYDNSATPITGIAGVAAGGTVMTIKRLDGAVFAASTNNTGLRASLTFEVQ
jgi:hypothetical protein